MNKPWAKSSINLSFHYLILEKMYDLTFVIIEKCVIYLFLSSKKCIFATEIFKFQSVMKRKIYKQLLKWKESKDRKPLMLLGARQVGKTWIMQHFGKRNTKT